MGSPIRKCLQFLLPGGKSIQRCFHHPSAMSLGRTWPAPSCHEFPLAGAGGAGGSGSGSCLPSRAVLGPDRGRSIPGCCPQRAAGAGPGVRCLGQQWARGADPSACPSSSPSRHPQRRLGAAVTPPALGCHGAEIPNRWESSGLLLRHLVPLDGQEPPDVADPRIPCWGLAAGVFTGETRHGIPPSHRCRALVRAEPERLRGRRGGDLPLAPCRRTPEPGAADGESPFLPPLPPRSPPDHPFAPAMLGAGRGRARRPAEGPSVPGCCLPAPPAPCTPVAFWPVPPAPPKGPGVTPLAMTPLHGHLPAPSSSCPAPHISFISSFPFLSHYP